jgi:hypothetical protein
LGNKEEELKKAKERRRGVKDEDTKEIIPR